MNRILITIHGIADRERAIKWIKNSPAGTRIEFKAAKRTLAQNDKVWVMLTEVSRQVRWHDKHLRPAGWRDLFMDALNRELHVVVPTLDGTGMLTLGRSTSDLGKAEASDLIELIYAFGAEHGVVFQEPGRAAPAGNDPPMPHGGSSAASPDPPQGDDAAVPSIPLAKQRTA